MSAPRGERPWKRRDLLATGCAVAATIGLSEFARANDPVSNVEAGPYGPFKLGLQSYSLRGLTKEGRPDLKQALDATKQLGLSFWESYTAHIPMESDPRKVESLKKELEASGVSLIGYGVVRLTKEMTVNRRVFDFARAMGLDYISANPDPDALDGIDRLLEEYNVAVGIHNHGPGHHYERIETIAKAIASHHPRLGCCIDTGHFLRSREDPVHAVETFGKRVYGVHLKDVKDATTFTVLGRGDLRTVDLLKALMRNKYEYCLAIEYEEKPENPLDDIKACLEEARQAIAQAQKV